MKLLVVCQYYKPEPVRISDICETLVQRGHEVLVVTGTPNYPEGEIYPGYENGKRADELLDGVRVHRCPIHPRKKGALHRVWNYYSFVFSSRRYLSKLNEDFDVVFVNQLSPVMMAEGALGWARRHGKKCVLYCLDLWPESLMIGGIKRKSPVYRVYYHISRRIYRRADEILITSRHFYDYFHDYLKLDYKKITYLPQYAETLFDDVPPVREHEPPYHFLFAGNIGQSQSVETIVGAARILREDSRMRFHIVGIGSNLEHCRRLAEGLSNVTFYGRRDVSEMPAFYAKADAMLMTLYDNPTIDTLPGKVQSYMASGRAILGAVNGETADVVREADCGVCARAEDAEGLALQIRKIADKPDRFPYYGKKAREYYLRMFQKDSFIKELTGALERNCRNRERG